MTRALSALLAVIAAVVLPGPAHAQTATTPSNVTMEVDPTLPTHTVYRPTAMEKLGRRKLPIIAFGNGSCFDNGAGYSNLLTGVAEHGYLVIALGPIGGSGRQLPRGVRATEPAQLIEAIDWAVKENDRADSKFHARLDTKAIAVMGHSCGALQALEVAGDPRIKTEVILNGGVFADLSARPGWTVTKAHLAHLHETLLYLAGGPDDIAHETANDDFGYIDGVPLFKGETDVGHMATYEEPNGGLFGKVVGAWLDWQLKNDQKAKLMFTGENCGLCTDKAWTVARKNMR